MEVIEFSYPPKKGDTITKRIYTVKGMSNAEFWYKYNSVSFREKYLSQNRSPVLSVTEPPMEQETVS